MNTTSRYMTSETNPTGIVGMLIFMLTGQMLMFAEEVFKAFYPGIYLFQMIDFDQYIVMLMHFLSVISFLITIIVGIPKAYKIAKDSIKSKITRRRKKHE